MPWWACLWGLCCRGVVRADFLCEPVLPEFSSRLLWGSWRATCVGNMAPQGEMLLALPQVAPPPGKLKGDVGGFCAVFTSWVCKLAELFG